MKERKIRYISKGFLKECPKCKGKMERRTHKEKPKKTWFYTEWDYCKPCGHLQHYDQYKSMEWQENERRQNFFNSI